MAPPAHVMPVDIKHCIIYGRFLKMHEQVIISLNVSMENSFGVTEMPSVAKNAF